MTIIANGTMTSVALDAAEKLFKDGIDAEVIHSPTVKPLDNVTILRSVRKTKRVIVIEEAQIAGGLGSAVTELLSEHEPVPIIRMGIKDRYGQSGQPKELLKHYGLTPHHVMLNAHHIMDK